jgi:hypothetical protein
MPEGNPAGYLRKPKEVKKKMKPKKKIGRAKTTKDLKARLKARAKKAGYLSKVVGN